MDKLFYNWLADVNSTEPTHGSEAMAAEFALVLDHLTRTAWQRGWPELAHLIGVAALAAEEMERRTGKGRTCH